MVVTAFSPLGNGRSYWQEVGRKLLLLEGGAAYTPPVLKKAGSLRPVSWDCGMDTYLSIGKRREGRLRNLLGD
jgi:hypothetical protein